MSQELPPIEKGESEFPKPSAKEIIKTKIENSQLVFILKDSPQPEIFVNNAIANIVGAKENEFSDVEITVLYNDLTISEKSKESIGKISRFATFEIENEKDILERLEKEPVKVLNIILEKGLDVLNPNYLESQSLNNDREIDHVLNIFSKCYPLIGKNDNELVLALNHIINKNWKLDIKHNEIYKFIYESLLSIHMIKGGYVNQPREDLYNNFLIKSLDIYNFANKPENEAHKNSIQDAVSSLYIALGKNAETKNLQIFYKLMSDRFPDSDLKYKFIEGLVDNNELKINDTPKKILENNSIYPKNANFRSYTFYELFEISNLIVNSNEKLSSFVNSTLHNVGGFRFKKRRLLGELDFSFVGEYDQKIALLALKKEDEFEQNQNISQNLIKNGEKRHPDTETVLSASIRLRNWMGQQGVRFMEHTIEHSKKMAKQKILLPKKADLYQQRENSTKSSMVSGMSETVARYNAERLIGNNIEERSEEEIGLELTRMVEKKIKENKRNYLNLVMNNFFANITEETPSLKNVIKSKVKILYNKDENDEEVYNYKGNGIHEDYNLIQIFDDKVQMELYSSPEDSSIIHSTQSRVYELGGIKHTLSPEQVIFSMLEKCLDNECKDPKDKLKASIALSTIRNFFYILDNYETTINLLNKLRKNYHQHYTLLSEVGNLRKISSKYLSFEENKLLYELFMQIGRSDKQSIADALENLTKSKLAKLSNGSLQMEDKEASIWVEEKSNQKRNFNPSDELKYCAEHILSMSSLDMLKNLYPKKYYDLKNKLEGDESRFDGEIGLRNYLFLGDVYKNIDNRALKDAFFVSGMASVYVTGFDPDTDNIIENYDKTFKFTRERLNAYTLNTNFSDCFHSEFGKGLKKLMSDFNKTFPNSLSLNDFEYNYFSNDGNISFNKLFFMLLNKGQTYYRGFPFNLEKIEKHFGLDKNLLEKFIQTEEFKFYSRISQEFSKRNLHSLWVTNYLEEYKRETREMIDYYNDSNNYNNSNPLNNVLNSVVNYKFKGNNEIKKSKNSWENLIKPILEKKERKAEKIFSNLIKSNSLQEASAASSKEHKEGVKNAKNIFEIYDRSGNVVSYHILGRHKIFGLNTKLNCFKLVSDDGNYKKINLDQLDLNSEVLYKTKTNSEGLIPIKDGYEINGIEIKMSEGNILPKDSYTISKSSYGNYQFFLKNNQINGELTITYSANKSNNEFNNISQNRNINLNLEKLSILNPHLVNLINEIKDINFNHGAELAVRRLEIYMRKNHPNYSLLPNDYEDVLQNESIEDWLNKISRQNSMFCDVASTFTALILSSAGIESRKVTCYLASDYSKDNQWKNQKGGLRIKTSEANLHSVTEVFVNGKYKIYDFTPRRQTLNVKIQENIIKLSNFTKNLVSKLNAQKTNAATVTTSNVTPININDNQMPFIKEMPEYIFHTQEEDKYLMQKITGSSERITTRPDLILNEEINIERALLLTSLLQMFSDGEIYKEVDYKIITSALGKSQRILNNTCIMNELMNALKNYNIDLKKVNQYKALINNFNLDDERRERIEIILDSLEDYFSK